MNLIAKFLVICGLVAPVVSGATELRGVADVNVTSDTAANAKNMAIDEARRQIIVDVLLPYAENGPLRAAVAKEKASVLTNLISGSGISGERQSDTAYSAKIEMTVNRAAAKNWMAAHDIKNWLGMDDDGAGRFRMTLVTNGAVDDWARFRRVAADNGINIDTVSIRNGQVVFSVPSSRRGAFTIALRDAGFQYQNRDDTLYIFK